MGGKAKLLFWWEDDAVWIGYWWAEGCVYIADDYEVTVRCYFSKDLRCRVYASFWPIVRISM